MSLVRVSECWIPFKKTSTEVSADEADGVCGRAKNNLIIKM